jgi:hypothetical protein
MYSTRVPDPRLPVADPSKSTGRPGSKRAANVRNRAAQPGGAGGEKTEEPRESSDRAAIIDSRRNVRRGLSRRRSRVRIPSLPSFEVPANAVCARLGDSMGREPRRRSCAATPVRQGARRRLGSRRAANVPGHRTLSASAAPARGARGRSSMRRFWRSTASPRLANPPTCGHAEPRPSNRLVAGSRSLIRATSPVQRWSGE